MQEPEKVFKALDCLFILKNFIKFEADVDIELSQIVQRMREFSAKLITAKR